MPKNQRDADEKGRAALTGSEPKEKAPPRSGIIRLCHALRYPGKPENIDGSQVTREVEEGRVAEVAAHCETGVVNTFRVWLTSKLFRGALTPDQFQSSEESPFEYLGQKVPAKPRLGYLLASGRF